MMCLLLSLKIIEIDLTLPYNHPYNYILNHLISYYITVQKFI